MLPDLDFLFHPQSIAIAGVSGDKARFNAGLLYLQSLINFGYKGKLYPLHPAGGEIEGLTIYPSVKDVPGPVDFVISAVPARHTPQLVSDAVEKHVKAIHFFTSGYSEIEDASGKALQEEILQIARKGGMRIIGPNCLGLYCPAGGITYNSDFSQKAGPVGMFSQSGGISAYTIQKGNARGLYFSKVISMGNGADLNESDYLEYLTRDADTRIILCYIEGVREGARFLDAMHAATSIKPVLVLKVGRSEPGASAAASHTATLTGSTATWEGLLMQAGAIQVDGVEEMVDVAHALLYLPPPAGRNTAILGIGGGSSILAADLFAESGVPLPPLPSEARKSLMDIYGSEAGRILKNPVDINSFDGTEVLVRMTKAIEHCANIDLLVLQLGYDHYGLIAGPYKELMTGMFLDSVIALKKEVHKPIAAILHSYGSAWTTGLALKMQDSLLQAGFPVFMSIQGAAVALGKYFNYHEGKSNIL